MLMGQEKARGEELKSCYVLYSQPFRQKGPKNNPPAPFGKSRFEREDTRTKFLSFLGGRLRNLDRNKTQPELPC